MNCPHLCGAQREQNDYGICNTGREFNIASIFKHHGEEPVLSGTKGICNIFFSHCNLQCVYCQNYQISDNRNAADPMNLEEVIERVTKILDEGISLVGFVSPSHMADQVREIINVLSAKGRKPNYVWNSNGYDRVQTLRSFEDLIDVYLPDFKYSDAGLGLALSGVEDYPEKAMKAIREMIRQKGTSIMLNDEGVIESGVIIRHLVLPGHVENSKNCLRMIAEEFSASVHISLMSQYHPVSMLNDHPELQRTISKDEYEEVQDEFHKLGFFRGWSQELLSESIYNPDFNNQKPFVMDDTQQ